MKRFVQLFTIALSLLVLASPYPVAAAQINSNAATVTLNVSIPESLSLSCTPSSISFTGTGGSSIQASAPISCTTTWNLANTRTSLNVYQYFSTNNPIGNANVMANFFWASVDGGTLTAFGSTQQTNAGFSGYFGPNLLSISSVGANQPSGNHTDTTTLTLTGANTLPPGTYSGTLNIQAVVI